jgi:hypothetical protein
MKESGLKRRKRREGKRRNKIQCKGREERIEKRRKGKGRKGIREKGREEKRKIREMKM